MVFGPFEFDSRAGRLEKHGYRIKLQPKSASVLAALLDRPGELLTREELHRHLWPEGTYVAFDIGLNVAIKKLRDALNDSADEPVYIQTVHGEGYRFIASVTVLRSRPAAAPAPSAPSLPPPLSRLAWRHSWAAAASLAATVIVMLITVAASHHTKPPFRNGDWVLIASFDNRSGDSRLDGTLEYALQRELSNSHFVSVVSQERVDDVLRLMRRPAGTRVDRVVGREICLRDGNIAVLLSGRVEKLGGTYELGIDIIDPVRDVVVAALSEDASSPDSLLKAIHRLADDVRQELGEESQQIRRTDLQLAKVTTPSLEALQLYTQAERLMHGTIGIQYDPRRQAAELLRQALQHDPEFASAHLLLGYCYSEGDDPRTKTEFSRAFQLAETATERERLFIIASYDKVFSPGDRLQAYEALVRLYPDHYWGIQNLAELYFKAGDIHQAALLWYRLAQLRPNDVEASFTAAQFALLENDRAAFHRFAERSQLLTVQPGISDTPDLTAAVRLLPADAAWLDGDVAGALVLVQRDQTLPAASRFSPVAYGHFYATLGQYRQAERIYESFDDARVRELILGRLAYVRGDMRGCREHLRRAPAYANPLDWWLRARCGVWSSAADITPDFQPWMKRNPAGAHVAAAELKLRAGDVMSAISELEPWAPLVTSEPDRTVAFVTLADAYESRGDLTSALRVLQPLASSRSLAVLAGGNLYGPYWLGSQVELAKLYRRLGRDAEAQAVESEVAGLLRYADADDPMLLALSGRSRPSAPAAGR